MKFGTNTVNVLVGSVGRNGNDRPRKAKLSLQEVWKRLALMPGTEFCFCGGFLSEDGTLYSASSPEKVRVVGSIGGAGMPLSLIVELTDSPGDRYMVNWKFHGVRKFRCDTILNTTVILSKRAKGIKGFVRDTQSVRGTRATVRGVRKVSIAKGAPIRTY